MHPRKDNALWTAAVVAAGLFAAAAAQPVAAQTAGKWPERNITIIVPFPAGSTTDLLARTIGQKLTERLGQQIVVDNRAGAGGRIGADAVARAAPDSYTILLTTNSTHAVAPGLGQKLPYDPVKDFAPISMIASTPFVLVTSPTLPARDVKELIALAKSKPNTINYGSAGVASLSHLAGALLGTVTETQLTHVPYKGSAQSVADMMAGRLEIQFAAPAPVMGNIRANQIRAIAVTSTRRLRELPDVPTMIEAGVPDYEVSLWLAALAPSKTPPAIIERLNKEIAAILPEVEKAMASVGLQLEATAPQEVTDRIQRETAKWTEVVRKANIQTR